MEIFFQVFARKILRVSSLFFKERVIVKKIFPDFRDGIHWSYGQTFWGSRDHRRFRGAGFRVPCLPLPEERSSAGFGPFQPQGKGKGVRRGSEVRGEPEPFPGNPSGGRGGHWTGRSAWIEKIGEGEDP